MEVTTFASGCNLTSMIISAFLGVHFVLLRQGNLKANRFLGLFLLSTTVSVLGSEVHHAASESHWLVNILLITDTPFLFAPLLLYYSLSVMDIMDTYQRKYIWVFIPAVLHLLLNVYQFLFAGSSALSAELVEELMELSVLVSDIFNFIVFLIIIKKLSIHQERVLNVFSSINDKTLNWLRWLVLVNLTFILIWLVDDSLVLLVGDNPTSMFIASLSLFATLINVLWMGFASLRQPVIFEGQNTGRNGPLTNEKGPNQVEMASGLKDQARNSSNDMDLFANICERVGQQKIYADPELTLRGLALQLEIRDKELSRIINQCYGNNFYHFINSYRVELFKEMCKDPNNAKMSIQGLASLAGFRSKSTFYTAFRKIEGMSPKQFADSLS